MKILHDLLALFFPRLCLLCGELLVDGEKCLCLSCIYKLPRTNYHLRPFNPAEQLFTGKIEIEKATAYLHYEKGGKVQQLIYAIKYKGEKEAGFQLGRQAALALHEKGFFEGIDLLLPVPLHSQRQKKRGYNQAEWIARGIASVCLLPIENKALARIRKTNTQTHKNVFDRWTNVQNIFSVKSEEPLIGKHVLVIDDVLTTGATIGACASCLSAIEGTRISILTLSIA
nr:ComF family protein [uncultured Macellibacteroides sp.]